MFWIHKECVKKGYLIGMENDVKRTFTAKDIVGVMNYFNQWKM